VVGAPIYTYNGRMYSPTTSPYGYSSFPKEEKLCRALAKLSHESRLFHLSFDLGVQIPYPYQCDMGANSVVDNQ
jgi:hypothetical protein